MAGYRESVFTNVMPKIIPIKKLDIAKSIPPAIMCIVPNSNELMIIAHIGGIERFKRVIISPQKIISSTIGATRSNATPLQLYRFPLFSKNNIPRLAISSFHFHE